MSNTICSYEGCYNSAFKIPGLKMFRFPRKCPETADIWIKNCGNPALKDEPIEKLYRSNRVCQRHFKESYILPSGRLMNGAIPEPFIREEEEEHLVKEEPEDCTSSSPSPEPLWRSKPAEKTYSSMHFRISSNYKRSIRYLIRCDPFIGLAHKTWRI